MTNKCVILDETRHLPSGIFQNYLVFIQATKCFKLFSGTIETCLWKFHGMSKESIENITTSDNSFAPTLINYYQVQDLMNNKN